MIMRFLVVLVVSASMSACGFHLRGKLPIPESLQTIAVKSSDRDLYLSLVDALSFAGATVVESVEDAQALLDLYDVKYDRRVLTIDDRGKVTGYTLEYRVNFRVTAASGESLRESIVVARRDFNFDPNLVLQAEIEARALRENMVDDLTQRILRQLVTIAAISSPTQLAGLLQPAAVQP